jgi:hypothetical protein
MIGEIADMENTKNNTAGEVIEVTPEMIEAKNKTRPKTPRPPKKEEKEQKIVGLSELLGDYTDGYYVMEKEEDGKSEEVKPNDADEESEDKSKYKIVKATNFKLQHTKTLLGDGTSPQYTIYKMTIFKASGVFEYDDIAFTGDTLSTATKFKAVLKGVDAAVRMEGPYIVDKITSYVDNPHAEIVKGTSICGLIGDRFVTPKAAYDLNLNPVKDITYLGSESTAISTSIMEGTRELAPAEFQELSEHIFMYNEPFICLGVIGWCMACLINPQLMRDEIKIPILRFNGEAGAGKSETADTVVASFFSMFLPGEDAGGMKKFPVQRKMSTSNMVPLMLEECKPSHWSKDQINTLSNVERTAYDHTSVDRGRADQGINKRFIVAPLVEKGENSTTEGAIDERRFTLDLMVAYKNVEGRKEHYHWIKANKPLLRNLGRTALKYVLSREFKPKEIESRVMELESKYLVGADRVNRSNAIVTYGYELFLEMAASYGVKGLPDMDKAAGIIAKATENSSSVEGSLSDFEQTLMFFDLMASKDAISSPKHYKVDKDTLSLNLKAIYDDYPRFMSENKLEKSYSVLTYREFTKVLSSKKYFLEYKPLRGFDSSKPKKVYSLSISKLEKDAQLLEYILDPYIPTKDEIEAGKVFPEVAANTSKKLENSASQTELDKAWIDPRQAISVTNVTK